MALDERARHELAQSNAISAQMKTLIRANPGTVVSIAALAFGVARLS